MTTPNRPPLSPAAQAVLDAAVRKGVELAVEQGLRGSCRNAEANMKAEIAAAFRAAADQVVPADPCGDDCCITTCENIRADLLAIAAELEAQP